MSCSERQRLFDHYYDQVSACFEELARPAKRGLFGDDAHARSVAADTERARLALEQHEREHGCGKIGSETYGAS